MLSLVLMFRAHPFIGAALLSAVVVLAIGKEVAMRTKATKAMSELFDK